MRRQLKNIPASVQARLLERARRGGNDYQVLFGAFVCERFLYRLGVSAVANRFLLKGAMLLRVWSEQPYRATRDLDLLRYGVGSADAVRTDVEAICGAEVEPDGITFDPGSVRLQAIRPEDEYAGVRVSLLARCGSARLPFQVDIGVGDAVWPPPEWLQYPTLLEFPAPRLLSYAKETVIAEKLEAMIVLGERNSRIKDFFDLYYLATHFSFDRETLAESVRRTFDRRNTAVPPEVPVGLTAGYWDNPSRPAQIRAFARRAGLEVGSGTITDILNVLETFLLPVLRDVRRGTPAIGTWPAGGPWRSQGSSFGGELRDV